MRTLVIRHAGREDLPAIVAIYNASIAGRMATADTEPVSIQAREGWFSEFDPTRRPIWVAEAPAASAAAQAREVVGWAGLRSFYGRPAYAATVEAAIYVAPGAQRRGVGAALLDHALAAAPACGIRSVLGFVFGHNAPSLALFARRGFSRWGCLPRVAELDGLERDLIILGLRLAP